MKYKWLEIERQWKPDIVVILLFVLLWFLLTRHCSKIHKKRKQAAGFGEVTATNTEEKETDLAGPAYRRKNICKLENILSFLDAVTSREPSLSVSWWVSDHCSTRRKVLKVTKGQAKVELMTKVNWWLMSIDDESQLMTKVDWWLKLIDN